MSRDESMYVKNKSTPFTSLYYPSARPQQIYRKQRCNQCYKVDTPLTMVKTCIPGPVNVQNGGNVHGNIISFSGEASIRSATTNVSPHYYSNYSAYLKRRAYESNSVNTKQTTVFPIYKPNNTPFSTEGGVDSSTYTSRRRYVSITENNNSFRKPYGKLFTYQPNPIFFEKNITNYPLVYRRVRV